MTATRRLKDVPGFTAGWKMTFTGPEGIHDVPIPRGVSWQISSRFGSIRDAVVMSDDGTPLFDKPVVYEAPATNVVAWGRGEDGSVRIGVIRQPRPHADDPEHQGSDGHPPVVFGQVPMGYLEKLLGGNFETPEQGAAREVGEETGATAVIRIERPASAWHNPNPTFVGSWTDLVFVEVDLTKIEVLKHDHSEPIYSAEYVPVATLRKWIREGRDETGAIFRMCTANSVWFIFAETHPELWNS